jgi:hypothetical protein
MEIAVERSWVWKGAVTEAWTASRFPACALWHEQVAAGWDGHSPHVPRERRALGCGSQQRLCHTPDCINLGELRRARGRFGASAGWQWTSSGSRVRTRGYGCGIFQWVEAPLRGCAPPRWSTMSSVQRGSPQSWERGTRCHTVLSDSRWMPIE